jgi:hypothetical protein
MYALNKNIVSIYPNYDTIYITDLKNNKTFKREILNLDFIAPKSYNIAKKNDNAYNTKYELENFRYQSFCYLEKSKEYILFYSKPIQKKYPTFNDQYYYYIVLDTLFNLSNYTELKRYFYHPDCRLIKNDSIIFLPILKESFLDEKPLILYSIN